MTEIDKFAGHEPELEIIILKDETKGEFFKKCLYKNETEILRIGENTYEKRLDKLAIHFPLVIFDVLEAKKYGFIVTCEGSSKFWSYVGLTCDPEGLILKKQIRFEEVIGCHQKEEIYQCPKCNKTWKIYEEFDTHHGYNRQCNLIS